jgi:hypothetical protein
VVHVIRKTENDVNKMPAAVLVVAAGSRGEAQGIVALTPLDELMHLKLLVAVVPLSHKGQKGT